MKLEKKIQLLEATYTGVLADAVRCFSNEGVLESVTEKKRKNQMALKKQQAERYEVTKPEEAFTRLTEIFNCASWESERNESGFIAQSQICKLCAITKKLCTNSPCRIYCLNPMECMIKGISPGSTFNVLETMWDGQKYRVAVVEYRSKRTLDELT